MPQALPLPDKIAAGSSKRTELKVIAAQFGDGYSQRAATGLNAQVDMWDVSWIPVNATDRDTIIAALDAVGGWDYLTWTPPGESAQKRFIVEPSSRSLQKITTYYRIACQLRQVF